MKALTVSFPVINPVIRLWGFFVALTIASHITSSHHIISYFHLLILRLFAFELGRHPFLSWGHQEGFELSLNSQKTAIGVTAYLCLFFKILSWVNAEILLDLLRRPYGIDKTNKQIPFLFWFKQSNENKTIKQLPFWFSSRFVQSSFCSCIVFTEDSNFLFFSETDNRHQCYNVTL